MAVRLEAVADNASRTYQGTARDISAGGMRITTQQKLEVGAETLIKAPAFGGSVRAIVRSCKGIPGSFEVGLQFRHAAEQERRMLMSA
jgi:hypothetical protein